MQAIIDWLKYWFAQILELVASMGEWKNHFFPETTTEA